MTVLKHIGMPRRSGRYPWGSGGKDPNNVVTAIENLFKEGFTEKEVADSFGWSIQELRNQKTIFKALVKEDRRIQAVKLREAGMSPAAIAREMKLPEQSVRDILKPWSNKKYKTIEECSILLADLADEHGFVDIGDGSEIFAGVTKPQFKRAVQMAQNEGYKTHSFHAEQLSSKDRFTRLKLLGRPDAEWKDIFKNPEKIAIPNFEKNEEGKLTLKMKPIRDIDSDRVLVKYANNGGADKDGLIELRRIPELNLGDNNYAQVRIGVDGTHFMKGMAVIRDDLPDGVDIIYNTNKKPTGNKLDAMKPQKTDDDAVSQFGAVVTQNKYIDKNGKEQAGFVNIVGNNTLAVEGSWSDWNSSLASQVLSKQSPKLAEKQLKILEDNFRAEFDEISKLTQPTVKNHILLEFAEKADRASVDLKAAALPGQLTQVLLPDPKMRPDEIFAPQYNDGEVLSLIRYPHGHISEIPTLRVNNRSSEYKKIIGPNAIDAVAIHPKVAQRLSGADFDGDFVLAIPNKSGHILTKPPLKQLEGFDPQKAYPKVEGMKVMPDKAKGLHMGKISNLITDMTIQGASDAELARAVKHSMVVIDAPKHELNWKASERDNGILALKAKYQGGERKGAATLISRAKSIERVDQRRIGYNIDPKTGEKIYSYTGATYKKNGKTIKRQQESEKLAERHPYELSSGTKIEKVYADHSLRMKTIGNQARLETLRQKQPPRDPEATRIYKAEVESLDAKYKAAVKSRPVERKAQILGKEIYKNIVDNHPEMSYADKRTTKARALQIAREKLGAKKPVIDITPREWTAIEMNAISPTRVSEILRNADIDQVRSYALPRTEKTGLSTAKTARAKKLMKAGYTTKEIADALGVPRHQVAELDK